MESSLKPQTLFPTFLCSRQSKIPKHLPKVFYDGDECTTKQRCCEFAVTSACRLRQLQMTGRYSDVITKASRCHSVTSSDGAFSSSSEIGEKIDRE
ncbi:Hypothetical predicted protein [Olea europaea subsp. europaea]|uniref:Uncharacterized protein n=1 Tax=Olea europaea subsp. europaea TaxID=158383 RepID=A0A8S0TF07_OLEEU|nr:Hypothetical predicted protein [Olea europaea subsp. europaea]